MDAWSALFVFAGSVSVAGFVASLAGGPGRGLRREREIVRKGLQRSLSDLDAQIWRLTMAEMDAEDGRAVRLRTEIERLDEMRESLARAEREIRDISREEWARVRDETLGALDQARRSLRDEGPEPAARHA